MSCRSGTYRRTFSISPNDGKSRMFVFTVSARRGSVKTALSLPLQQAPASLLNWHRPSPIGTLEDLYSLSCSPQTSYCAGLSVARDYVAQSKSGGSSWTETPIDTATTDTDGNIFGLISISCPVAGSCVAIDEQGNAISTTNSFAAWSVKRFDPPKLNSYGVALDLMAVSCASLKLCVAVDASGHSLYSTDFGRSWRSVLIDHNRVDAVLTSVSCISRSVCVAVDQDSDLSSSASHIYRTQDGGHSWRVVDTDRQGLVSVSCATVEFCAAADESGRILMTSDAGTRWTSSVPDLPPYPNYGVETQVSCVTPHFCVVTDAGSAGYRRGSGYASTFDGTGWSTPTLLAEHSGFPSDTPVYGGTASLSCASTKLCVAGVINEGAVIVGTRSAVG